MPTLSEFIMTIGLRYNEADDTTQTFFRFETMRQFQAFRYEVEVEAAMEAEARTLSFTIKGVRAPVALMAATGSAVTEFCYPSLEGEYRVLVSGAKQSGQFRLKASPRRIELLDQEKGDFVQLRLADEIETIRA